MASFSVLSRLQLHLAIMIPAAMFGYWIGIPKNCLYSYLLGGVSTVVFIALDDAARGFRQHDSKPEPQQASVRPPIRIDPPVEPAPSAVSHGEIRIQVGDEHR